MSRYYVAGPMSGYEYYNYPAFDAAEKYLVAIGHKVITPANLSREIGTDPIQPMDVYAKADIEAIFCADTLYFLKGWEKSVGARAEHALAVWLGKEIYYETSLET